MAHTCRGTISLHGAVIHTENQSCNFIVSNGGGTQVKASPTYCPFFNIFFFFIQTFHLRATNEVERQKWVTALELAKAKAIQVSTNLPGGYTYDTTSLSLPSYQIMMKKYIIS